MMISVFSVSVPTLIWTRHYKVSGEILKVEELFTFYHFSESIDLLDLTRFLKVLGK